jgi:putative transposase
VNREFSATRPDQLWVADFNYCSTWSGVVYVAFIIDVFSRWLVGWKASRSMTAELVVDALDMAAWTRRHTTLDNLICHTDAGSAIYVGSLHRPDRRDWRRSVDRYRW